VLYLAIFFTDNRETLLSVSFALGVGFAILEDAVILAQNINSVSIGWALARVIGAALMHGACTSMIGMGISYINKRKKLFFCGTFALLAAAILTHATFNVLVQSDYRIAAFIFPASVYIPTLVKELTSRKAKAKSEK
jgi:RsiW-degrading membrane proteinase PrsW (M82 family)